MWWNEAGDSPDAVVPPQLASRYMCEVSNVAGECVVNGPRFPFAKVPPPPPEEEAEEEAEEANAEAELR